MCHARQLSRSQSRCCSSSVSMQKAPCYAAAGAIGKQWRCEATAQFFHEAQWKVLWQHASELWVQEALGPRMDRPPASPGGSGQIDQALANRLGQRRQREGHLNTWTLGSSTLSLHSTSFAVKQVPTEINSHTLARYTGSVVVAAYCTARWRSNKVCRSLLLELDSCDVSEDCV